MIDRTIAEEVDEGVDKGVDEGVDEWVDEGVDEWVTDKELSLIHISEPTRQEAISYAVFCLKKKNLKVCSNLSKLTS